MNEAINGFARPPRRRARTGSADRAGAASMRRGIDLLPSDDWPQLYLREREIPWAPIGQGMLVVALLSLAILLAFAPARPPARRTGRCSSSAPASCCSRPRAWCTWRCCSARTWIVNSVVFFAILVMILCANLYVLKVKPRKLLPTTCCWSSRCW